MILYHKKEVVSLLSFNSAKNVMPMYNNPITKWNGWKISFVTKHSTGSCGKLRIMTILGKIMSRIVYYTNKQEEFNYVTE